MTLAQLIEALGGTLVFGDPATEIGAVSAIAQAGIGDLVFAEDAASAAEALEYPASALVVKQGLFAPPPGRLLSIAVVETAQPKLWFARAAKMLKPEPECELIHPTAVIGEGAVLSGWVTVGPHAVIGKDALIGEWTRIDAGAVVGEGVRILDHCHIYPRVVIYPNTSIGNRVVVHAGCVLGADGFGYVRDAKTGAYTQFPQQGGLVIEDDVEIGANCTIDRGALGVTRIRRGTKFDNLVHIAHNCDIGEDVIIVAQTGISGSCTVGNGAVIAGQVGLGDHVHVGPGVILGGQSGVFSGKRVTNEGLKPGTVHWGTPARPLQQVLREQATLAKLSKRQKRRDPES